MTIKNIIKNQKIKNKSKGLKPYIVGIGTSCLPCNQPKFQVLVSWGKKSPKAKMPVKIKYPWKLASVQVNMLVKRKQTSFGTIPFLDTFNEKQWKFR